MVVDKNISTIYIDGVTLSPGYDLLQPFPLSTNISMVHSTGSRWSYARYSNCIPNPPTEYVPFYLALFPECGLTGKPDKFYAERVVVELPVGLSTLTFVGNDNNTLGSQPIKIDFIVKDIQEPSFRCPDLKFDGGPGGIYRWSIPTSLPICGPTVMPQELCVFDNYQINRSSCTGPPGNNGNYSTATRYSPFVCVAVDAFNNTANCTFALEVIDKLAPLITCPADFTANTDLNLATASPFLNVTATTESRVPLTPNCTCPNCTKILNSAFNVGKNFIVCVATNPTSFLTTACNFTLTVKDMQKPIIANCPSVTYLVNASATSATALVLLSQFLTVSDNVQMSSAGLVCSPNGVTSPYAFPMGVSPVACSANDAFNNTANCTFSLLVSDVTPPVFASCPLVTLFTAGTYINVNYSMTNSYGLLSTDNVNGASAPITCIPLAQNTKFPVGDTSVTCTATDAALNSAQCTFNVRVIDNSPPLLNNSCLDITYTNASFSTVNNTVPIPRFFPTDNVGVTRTTLSVYDSRAVSSAPVFEGPALDAIFNNGFSILGAPGNARFTYSVYDLAGGVSSCDFFIAVRIGVSTDLTAPVIYGCPTSFTTTNDAPSSKFSDYNSSYTTLNFTADASGYAIIPKWPNITDFDAVLSAASFYYPLRSADFLLPQCSVTALSVTLCPGRYVVAYQANDAAGNNALCVYLIVVNDSLPPTWVNPPPSTLVQVNCTVSVENPYGSSQKLPSISKMEAKDNYHMMDVNGTCESTPRGLCPPSGSVFTKPLPIGNVMFTYTAVDDYNNPAIPYMFTIGVQDLCPPRLVLLFPDGTAGSTVNIIYAETSYGKANGSIVCPAISVFDNSGYAYFTVTSVPPGYNCSSLFPISPDPPVILTVTAFDASLNSESKALAVIMRDKENPVLAGCGVSGSILAINFTCDASKNTTRVIYPTLTAKDNSGSVNMTITADFANNTDFPCGPGKTHTISFVAKDKSGNSATCVVLIALNDREPPVILGRPAQNNSFITYQINTTFNLATGRLTLPSLSATDNVGIKSIEFKSGLNDYIPGQTRDFPVGTTLILYTVIDTSLLSALFTVIVVVKDIQPATFTSCPWSNNGYPNSSRTFNTSLNSATAPVTWEAVTANDNVDGAGVSFYQTASRQGLTRESLFPIGNTTVTYSVFDVARNINTCTFRIQVVDNQPPMFSYCPDNIVTQYAYDESNIVVDWVEPVCTDNTGFLACKHVNLYAGALFSVGSFPVSYTAQDAAGFVATCTFIVNVTKQAVPVSGFSFCPSSIRANYDHDLTFVAVTWQDPTCFQPPADGDHTPYETILADGFPAPGSNFTTGSHLISYYSRDYNNVTVWCNFSVNVTQSPVPTVQPSSSADPSMIYGAGAGGGALLIILVILIALQRRKEAANRKRFAAAQSGYADLLAMSDEFILERARNIQSALMTQRNLEPPAAVTTAIIRPKRKFAAPPTDLEGLENYIRETHNKEIDRDQIEFGSELGKGEFGAVWEGLYLVPDPRLKIAIKMLRQDQQKEDKVKFLKEAAIMCQFDHPNIVALTGVCTLPIDQPTMIILEYMTLGALHGYLQSPIVTGQLEVLTMLRMALDVGAGMQYLAEAGFIHRDLAARNVLLDNTMTCRVADFGLSVDLATAESGSEEEGTYAGSEGAKIPIRWSAIEAVLFHQFSSASDVWSFGVLLWEIWSYAAMPYQGMPNRKVTEQVNGGYRLHKPNNCPDEVYKIMIECWNKNVKRRCTFPKANTMLVQAWKDICNDAANDKGEMNIYDNNTDADVDGELVEPIFGKLGKSHALYDNNEEVESAPLTATRSRLASTASFSLYDNGESHAIGQSPEYSSAASGDNAFGPPGETDEEQMDDVRVMLAPVPAWNKSKSETMHEESPFKTLSKQNDNEEPTQKVSLLIDDNEDTTGFLEETNMDSVDIGGSIYDTAGAPPRMIVNSGYASLESVRNEIEKTDIDSPRPRMHTMFQKPETPKEFSHYDALSTTVPPPDASLLTPGTKVRVYGLTLDILLQHNNKLATVGKAGVDTASGKCSVILQTGQKLLLLLQNISLDTTVPIAHEVDFAQPIFTGRNAAPVGVIHETDFGSSAPAVNASPRRKSGVSAMSESDVGSRVMVKNFGVGTLRFFGPHKKDGINRAGVELDVAGGINNGTAGGHYYFECPDKHGVLVDVRLVELLPKEAVKSGGYVEVAVEVASEFE